MSPWTGDGNLDPIPPPWQSPEPWTPPGSDSSDSKRRHRRKVVLIVVGVVVGLVAFIAAADLPVLISGTSSKMYVTQIESLPQPPGAVKVYSHSVHGSATNASKDPGNATVLYALPGTPATECPTVFRTYADALYTAKGDAEAPLLNGRFVLIVPPKICSDSGGTSTVCFTSDQTCSTASILPVQLADGGNYSLPTWAHSELRIQAPA
jgi:hypothetical protein